VEYIFTGITLFQRCLGRNTSKRAYEHAYFLNDLGTNKSKTHFQRARHQKNFCLFFSSIPPGRLTFVHGVGRSESRIVIFSHSSSACMSVLVRSFVVLVVHFVPGRTLCSMDLPVFLPTFVFGFNRSASRLFTTLPVPMYLIWTVGNSAFISGARKFGRFWGLCRFLLDLAKFRAAASYHHAAAKRVRYRAALRS